MWKSYFIACLCNGPKSFLVCHCWLAVAIYQCLSKPNQLSHTVVFPVGHLCHGLIVTLGKPLSQLLDCRLDSSSTSYVISEDLRQSIHTNNPNASFKSIIHLLVANAMSVCNLVSTLFFLSEFTKGVDSDLTMSYFSLRGGSGGG